MKSAALLAAASAAVVAAQSPGWSYNETTRKYTCAKPNAAYCIGDSMKTDIILRCFSTLEGHPGRCGDNLAGEQPVGNSVALCYQTDDTKGDAACEKNCVIYGGSGNFPGISTLPVDVCQPSYTAPGSGSGSATVSTGSATANPTTSSGSGSADPTTAIGDPTLYPTTAAPSTGSSASTTSTATPSNGTSSGGGGGGGSDGGGGSGTSAGGGGSSSGGSASGSGSSQSNVPAGTSATGTPTSGTAANSITGALAVLGLIAAYFL